ncbi:tyrosine-type recombinase/integrase [uncultured Treponema sp.]|uniref:tyrosine-type recombinase/integrase n=1 Tax=uncultured Treponema sp. TaxID=162155 RepID=UPI00344E2485
MDSNRSERRPEGGRGRKDAPDSERRRLEGANRRFETGSRLLPQLKEKPPVSVKCEVQEIFYFKHNDLKACMDSKRNECAMHTGMRVGEIQTLTVDDLGEDEIYVRRSWSKYDGLKCCKNGEERSVPIPISHQLYLKLKMLADFNPHENGFIFYSTVKDKPMDSKQFNKYLKRALAEIGYAI